MKMRLLFSTVAMLLAVGAHAATFDLFGKTYNVSEKTLSGASFVGGTISTTNVSGVGLDFVQGATPAQDRLYMAISRLAGSAGSGLLYLTGADSSGVFSSSSNIDFYFGTSCTDTQDGRPSSVYVRSLTDTGAADKNVYMSSFDSNDSINIYDFTNFPSVYTGAQRVATLVYQTGTVLTGGGAALEEYDGSNRALMVGGVSGKIGCICTLDMDALTQDANGVGLTGTTLVAGDQLRDIAKLSDGSYIVTGAPANNQNTRSRVIKLTISGTSANPPVLTATTTGEVNLNTAGTWPDFTAGSAWIWGAAAGRGTGGNDVLYFTAISSTAPNAVTLYTLTPVTSSVENWKNK